MFVHGQSSSALRLEQGRHHQSAGQPLEICPIQMVWLGLLVHLEECSGRRLVLEMAGQEEYLRSHSQQVVSEWPTPIRPLDRKGCRRSGQWLNHAGQALEN